MQVSYVALECWKMQISAALMNTQSGQVDQNWKYKINHGNKVIKMHSIISFKSLNWLDLLHCLTKELQYLDMTKCMESKNYQKNSIRISFTLNLLVWLYIEKSSTDSNDIFLGYITSVTTIS